ncbi:MAG: potassium/proton antiporter, partial [Kiloniellales bacterium]
MLDTIYSVILIAAGLGVVSIFTSLISFRIGAPLLLVFLLLGLAAGEDGLLGIPFDNPQIAYFIGSVCLAVILFDSGFGTSVHSVRLAAWPAATLATVGTVATAIFTGLAAHFLFGFDWALSLLVGAVVSPTDAAAVFFLIRVGGITLRDRVRSTLEIESGSNDPVAIFLSITLVEYILAGGEVEAVGATVALAFMQEMGLGAAIGLPAGWAIGRILNRIQLEPGLFPLFSLCSALILFALVNLLHGSGFLAVYLAGLVIGNMRVVAAHTLSRFQNGMTWLAQIAMFLTLGLLATPSHFMAVLWPALALSAFLVLVARPLAVLPLLVPFRFPRAEALFVSWVGLRGAVSILLAILPMLAGLDQGGMIFNIAFVVVVSSLLVQGWTVRPLARWLGLIVPPRSGVVDRYELDLPGGGTHELLAYRVADSSRVARGDRIPRWAQPSLVVRGGKSLRYHLAGRLQVGDQVLIFVQPRHAELLDRLFAARVESDDSERIFFGDFTVAATTPLSDLAALYEAVVPPGTEATTAGDLMHALLGERLEVGDRVNLGPIDVIVRDVDERNRASVLGIAVEPQRAAG